MEPRAAHIAAVYLDKSHIGDVEMKLTIPEPDIDQLIDSVGDRHTFVSSRFLGGLFV